MLPIHTIETAYHPKNKMGFLLDWIVTLKCNYDCSYCDSSGHDNSTQHPPMEKCIRMLKQMYQYVDLMMQYKQNQFKDAILNVYGGEALYHPEIEKILIETTREFELYKNTWRLKRRLTTNATATEKKWKSVCEHLEGITFSYHSQGAKKMKTLFKKNIDYVLSIKKEYDIIVCAFPRSRYWQDCINFLEYCKQNKLNARPRLLDGPLGLYNQKQLEELAPYLKDDTAISIKSEIPIDKQTRGCCGGRQLCVNRNLRDHQTMIPRDQGFEGWHCSANWFFLHGNSVNGEYYTNKDCRVKLLEQSRGSIANVDNMNEYIEKIKNLLLQNKLPTMKCVQKICKCGTCAPKSLHLKNLEPIMKIYNINSIN
jgi:organic radical activating enzyme